MPGLKCLLIKRYWRPLEISNLVDRASNGCLNIHWCLQASIVALPRQQPIIIPIYMFYVFYYSREHWLIHHETYSPCKVPGPPPLLIFILPLVIFTYPLQKWSFSLRCRSVYRYIQRACAAKLCIFITYGFLYLSPTDEKRCLLNEGWRLSLPLGTRRNV